MVPPLYGSVKCQVMLDEFMEPRKSYRLARNYNIG